MTTGPESLQADVLVVGTGIAGLTFALRVAEFADILLITKKARVESNTNYAQGGIAAVVGEGDSFTRHARDTLRAGAGLCHMGRVVELVRNGPGAVADLIDWGVRFTSEDGRLALGREGGHSRPRIVHSRDLTGPAIESALVEAVGTHPRIRMLEDHMCLDLRVVGQGQERRCIGAWALDVNSGRLLRLSSSFTLLATGGAAASYLRTTNPAIATGDGVAMAYRAGAAIANMEFVQFHPTALFPAEERAFLITEALRGAGAVLRNRAGDPFMVRYDDRGDLAPRDIVARAVHAELRREDEEHVWLDATGIGAEELETRFPAIMAGCAERDIDPRTEPVPVVPAAHYMCGGVWTNMDGQATLPGLFAAGECSCTGVHGANRLASNSLLEAVVFAERAAEEVVERLPGERPRDVLDDPGPDDLCGIAPEGIRRVRGALARFLWNRLGIVRGFQELVESRSELAAIAGDWTGLVGTASPGGNCTVWERAAETGFMLEIAGLILRSAIWRRESRGLHFDREHPYRNNEAYLRDTFIRQGTRGGSNQNQTSLEL